MVRASHTAILRSGHNCAVGLAFESRDNREGRRLNRQLERVRTLLKDIYEQWAEKA